MQFATKTQQNQPFSPPTTCKTNPIPPTTRATQGWFQDVVTTCAPAAAEYKTNPIPPEPKTTQHYPPQTLMPQNSLSEVPGKQTQTNPISRTPTAPAALLRVLFGKAPDNLCPRTGAAQSKPKPAPAPYPRPHQLPQTTNTHTNGGTRTCKTNPISPTTDTAQVLFQTVVTTRALAPTECKTNPISLSLQSAMPALPPCSRHRCIGPRQACQTEHAARYLHVFGYASTRLRPRGGPFCLCPVESPGRTCPALRVRPDLSGQSSASFHGPYRPP